MQVLIDLVGKRGLVINTDRLHLELTSTPPRKEAKRCVYAWSRIMRLPVWSP